MSKRLLDLIKLELFFSGKWFPKFSVKKAGGRKVHSAGLCLLEEREMCGLLGLDAHTGEEGHFPGCSVPRELQHKHTPSLITSTRDHLKSTCWLSFTCTHRGSRITHQAYAKAPQLEVLFTLLSGVCCYCGLAFAEPAWCLTHWARAEGWGV